MASLRDILSAAGVQDTFIDSLENDGWTKELFAMSSASLEKLDDELPEMLGDLFATATPVQKAALRLAWTRCNPSSSASSSTEHAQGPTAPPAAPVTSWLETFPPKLTSAIVSDLKQTFKRNYPAEVLMPENTPSLRLLSLLHHQKQKGEWKWVPWKYRISQAKDEELSASKSSKLAKVEGVNR